MSCGGHHPADIAEPNTIACFRQAIEAHNASANDTLQFVEIVSATQQVVAGFVFRGVVKCTKGGVLGEYEVEVWQKPGAQEIQLNRCEPK